MAGACVARGRGQRVWRERRPLQRTVRILLEYILVLIEITIHVFYQCTSSQNKFELINFTVLHALKSVRISLPIRK